MNVYVESLKVQFLVLCGLYCTLPLSVLFISSLSLNHHLYAECWRHNFSSLFIDLFSTPASLSFSILSNGYLPPMTANLLALNSFKTEFLLIGLPQQLAKINTSSWITTHSARNLGAGVIFDEYLAFSDQISALYRFCYYHIRELRCIRLILTSKLPVPSPFLSFILNLTTATHWMS